MRRALRAARAAGARGEVPVGAVAVRDGAVLATAGNAMERRGDATAHAEMLVLRRVATIVGRWRLDGVTLYATLEPCPMCAGAMVQARIAACVYGASIPRKALTATSTTCCAIRTTTIGSTWISGVGASESAALLQDFFRARR